MDTPVKPLTSQKKATPQKSRVTKIPATTATKTIPAKPGQLKIKSATVEKTIQKPVAKKSDETSARTNTDRQLELAPENKTVKPVKVKKVKLVRDSFTIPKPEYQVLDDLKLRAADLKHPIKKGELLRAGIKALAAMTNPQLLIALQAVPALKTGRPSK
jgi:hypothetical protein